MVAEATNTTAERLSSGEGVVTDVPTRGRGTVSWNRKVQVRQYEAAEAFMSVQFDFDPTAPIESDDSLLASAKGAFFEAKAVVFDELGIRYEVVDGVIREIIEKHFGPVTEVTKDGDSISDQLDKPQPQARPAAGSRAKTADAECPSCAGPMWDNREGKRNPKAPDFKCKNKDCDGAIWPKKEGD